MVKLLSMNAAAGKIFPSRMIVWLVPVLLFLAAVAASMASAGVLRVAGSFVPAAAADGAATGLAGAAENVAAAAGTAADNAVANGIIRAGEQAGAEAVVNAAPLATSAAESIFGDRGLTAEARFINGVPWQPGGDPLSGSIRLDVVEGPLTNPTWVWDYKFGGAELTPARIIQIRTGGGAWAERACRGGPAMKPENYLPLTSKQLGPDAARRLVRE